MIPLLYKKDGTTKIGELTNCIECLVEEERNGLFEASIVYPTTDSIFNSLEEENVIICDANDTLKAQKFRIYMTRKLMSNKIEVYARHISFDLAYDYIDNIDITNQSCEYALNTIFRNSQFSTHYRGYSDIVNAQNYKMSMANCIEAIAGKEGSIIDTFGTGAEILRDNTNIHLLNKRGHDNEVSIEYAKNLTGFELEEDYSELVTRINAYAKYTNSETNEEVLVEAKSIDSPLITNYSHPYVAYIDYSDKFEDEEIPTKEKLIELAKKEYSINNKDKPKQNYKIEFVPLSKCVGYEGLEDKISLCDTVTIKDTRYGINTKSKVIRTVFDVLKNRYDSMELGEPKTTLGDIIGGSGEDGAVGPPGPQGPPGADGNIGDFPNSLPSTPILSSKLYGFSNIELNWTYENKVYYNYELYASKIKDFTPNVFDIIHQGQTSSFLFQAKPDETWYFRVCCVNSHGNRTEFSSQIAVTTTKVDNLSNYVDNMAIGDALIGTLSLDRGWIGKLNANYLDVKGNFSVTDGNGKRTLDIDSFGNVRGDVTEFSINSVNVEESINREGNMIPNSNFLYDIEGYQALGGSISHYSYEKTKEDVIEDIPSDNLPIPSKPSESISGIPSGGNITVEPPPVSDAKPPVALPSGNTRMHFILTPSCGDCILIQCDNGINILIDAPNDDLVSSSYADNTVFIENYLKEVGVNHLNYVICTHFHSDHAGALPYIMEKFCDKSSVFMYRDVDSTKLAANSKEVSWKTQQYRDNCINTVNSIGMALKQPINNELLTIDTNTSLTFYKGSTTDYSNYNLQSLAMIFKYKSKKVLLLGDIPKTVQQELYSSFGKVDIVKDAHHGYNQTISLDICRSCGCKDVIVTRNHGFDTGYYRACNSVGIWQSYEKNIYTLHNTNNHILIDFVNNDYVISTGKRFYFENCWLKIEDKWCYLKQGGMYAKNESLTLDGNKTYDFNINGYCTNPYNPR